MKDYGDLETFVGQLLNDLTNLSKPQSVFQWTPDHEFLIARLKYLHNILIHPFENALSKILDENQDFLKRYKDFLELEGFSFDEERNKITARESAYLVINKIFFYKTIENKYKDKIDPLRKIEDYDKIHKTLQNYFEAVSNKVDFRAVFENKSLYNEIPFTREISILLNEFIDELSQYKLDDLGNIMGMVYKNIIPKEEKKQFGQYYTDSDIAKLMAELCIKDKDTEILDPACGSGTFLIEAYNILKNLSGQVKDENALHNKILEQLLGVEINQFPAHLSVMQLTMQNIKAETNIVNIIVRDFFNVQGRDFYGKQYVRNLNNELIQKGIIPKVDVVLANPPYIRQEAIKKKDVIRKTTLLPKGLEEQIGGRSDIYVYFFIRALEFLKEKGSLGFITSNSWLDVEFGIGLKQYFLDTCKINSIIAFDKDVFEDAIVNTCITILEKEKDEKERGKKPVNFIRVKKRIDMKKLIGLISKREPYEDDDIKIITINQEMLKPKQKWTSFHRAPLIYFELLESKKITKLADSEKPEKERIAEVSYPYKTGANDFFIISKEKAKLWGIEKKYLRSVITSPRDLNSAKIDIEKNTEYLLMVNKPKTVLRDEGAKVLTYILNGEESEVLMKRGKDAGISVKGYHNVPSLSNKLNWYALEDKDPAPILFQQMFRKRIMVFDNTEKSYATHNFYEIKPSKEAYIYPLLAYLNSSIGELCIELNGRYPGNGLLELMVYEVADLPVLNPEMLSQREQNKLKTAFIHFEEKGDKKILDDVIYEILGISVNEQKQVANSLIDLREIRKSIKKKDISKDNMINAKTTGKKPKLLRKDKEVKQLRSLKKWLEKE